MTAEMVCLFMGIDGSWPLGNSRAMNYVKPPPSYYLKIRIRNAAKRKLRLRSAREKARHSPKQWLRILVLCGNRCVRCGEAPKDGKLHKDHIRPIYQGGSDGPLNLQPLCRFCNLSKGPENDDLRPAWVIAEIGSQCFARLLSRLTDC